MRTLHTLPTPVSSLTHPDSDVPQDTLNRIERSNRYTVQTYNRPAMMMVRGKGSYLYDTQDRAYLDFTAGIAVTALGHSDPQVADILATQAQRLVHISNLYHNEHAGSLAETLVTTTQQHGGAWASKVFFTNSGTEANEGALKFARKWGKTVRGPDKMEIVCFTNAFHGRSMGALSATYNPKYQTPFQPLVPGFVTVPFNDTQRAVEAITERTCAVLIEPIQGEGGVHAATEEFMTAIRSQCNKTNALLIFDEIQCGLSRTGKLWGHQHLSQFCQPDILTMAKPMANGVPVGAIMTNAAVGDEMKTGEHGTTFGGNPLACAVANHVVGRITHPKFILSVNEKGTALKQDLQALQARYPDVIRHVRGQGLLLGIEFTKDPLPLVKMARERGLLIVTAGCNTVRIVPPLTVSQEEAREAVARLAGAVEQWHQMQ
ncbi:pyridoxal phosphate-dependent transferase [Spinellus fusiger]|nr:pyridoxal phosphate-dependent transferase [Spinellus fusiger]